VRIPDLNLKFVVHDGLAMRQRMAGREELMGADVIVVHRLLKNEVVERLGVNAYALFTQATIDAIGVDPAAMGMAPLTEAYEHLGDVSTWVLDLERRWADEDARQRVFVTPEASWFTQTVATVAPPQLAWEFVTSPARRPAWQFGVTEVDLVGGPANRRAVGATNHCRHGTEGGVVEEILDWRPYDYLTEATTMSTPMGPVKFVTTIELEPTPAGTVVHLRFAPPKSARERAIMREMTPAIAGMFEHRGAALAAQLEAELGARAGGEESDLPTPRPDGVLASIARMASP
jgi:uncharacterized protein YndB with AHSA1/START domain